MVYAIPFNESIDFTHFNVEMKRNTSLWDIGLKVQVSTGACCACVHVFLVMVMHGHWPLGSKCR